MALKAYKRMKSALEPHGDDIPSIKGIINTLFGNSTKFTVRDIAGDLIGTATTATPARINDEDNLVIPPVTVQLPNGITKPPPGMKGMITNSAEDAGFVFDIDGVSADIVRSVNPGGTLQVQLAPLPLSAPGTNSGTNVPITVTGQSGRPTIDGFSTIYLAKNTANQRVAFTISGTQMASGGYQSWTSETWAVVVYSGTTGNYEIVFDTRGFAANEVTRPFTLTANNDSGQTSYLVTATVDGSVEAPPPAPPPVGPPTLNEPTLPPGQTFVPYTLPTGVSVVETIFDYTNNGGNPRYWQPWALGMHTNSRKNGDPSWPTDATFDYAFNRSWDEETDRNQAAMQWARMEPTRGNFDWTPLDEWIDRHPGKLLIYTLGGTPLDAQIYPGEAWGYPYLPGGASPPQPGRIAEFIQAMRAHLLARYGREDVIWIFEPFNEPRVYEQDTSFDSRYNTADQTKFFYGTARQMATMAVETKDNLPTGTLCGCFAWEGKTSFSWTQGTFYKVMTVLQQLGRMDVIEAYTVHSYTYRGPTEWIRYIAEMQSYFAAIAFFGMPNVLVMLDTEDGAEYHTSDANGPVGMRLAHYSDQEQADWMERKMLTALGLGYAGICYYVWRQTEFEFHPGKPLTNARAQELNDRGDCWVYKVQRVQQNGVNKLYYSYIKDGVQTNRIV